MHGWAESHWSRALKLGLCVCGTSLLPIPTGVMLLNASDSPPHLPTSPQHLVPRGWKHDGTLLFLGFSSKLTPILTILKLVLFMFAHARPKQLVSCSTMIFRCVLILWGCDDVNKMCISKNDEVRLKQTGWVLQGAGRGGQMVACGQMEPLKAFWLHPKSVS